MTDICFDELKIAAARLAERYSWKFIRQYNVQPNDIEAHKAIFFACHKLAIISMWRRLEARGHVVVEQGPQGPQGPQGQRRPTTQRHIDRFVNALTRTIEAANDRFATRH